MTDPRLCLALDGAAAADPVGWVRATRHVFGTFKIGLELFCARGPGIVEACREAGASRIFLDLKLHDIPQTVARAIAALAGLRVDYLTVHAAGGLAMLRAAQEARGATRLLAVSVLTSLDAADAAALGFESIERAVERRVGLAREAGITGVVCSPHEARAVRALGLDPVTPGMRWAGAARQDQSRVGGPAETLAAGAHMLVIGRMITAADDLPGALERLASACR